MWEPGNVFTVVQNADTRESAQSKDVFNKYISGLTIGDQSVSDILKSSIPGDIQIPLVFEDLPDSLKESLEKNTHDTKHFWETILSEQAETGKPPHIVLSSTSSPVPMRSLGADNLNQLVHVSGIVVSVSKPRPKATNLFLKCRSCNAQIEMTCPAGLAQIQVPRNCTSVPEDNPGQDKKCPNDPYVYSLDNSSFVNYQRIKLQELPEDVPTGEVPRHTTLYVDRTHVEVFKPGERISTFAVFASSTPQAGGSIADSPPYLHVLAIKALAKNRKPISERQQGHYREMAARTDIQELLAANVCPSITGNEDIKKAILCQMFGGTSKNLHGGLRLRGDINILLVGDPGTAKSQFLKYVEKVSPISIYTSGKGSSAAGLTASVIRDQSGEFYLEGGAMVLADGGVVCVDEFDKMREQDRVAIHEAMEQQTISIAKAGITTILNSRTAVLAAANPIAGSYDLTTDISEQLNFQTSILSRFDLIFIVRDPKSRDRDMAVSKFVLQSHKGVNRAEETADQFDLTGYVQYSKSRCQPRMTEETAKELENQYISMREESHSAFPITLRQFEALVRLAESLARMRLSQNVSDEDVKEAVRLFQVSTLDSSIEAENLQAQASNVSEPVKQCILGRLPVEGRISFINLRKHLQSRGHSSDEIAGTIRGMCVAGELRVENKNTVRRIRAY